MSVLVREHVLEKYLCIFAFSEGVEVANELCANCVVCSLRQCRANSAFLYASCVTFVATSK